MLDYLKPGQQRREKFCWNNQRLNKGTFVSFATDTRLRITQKMSPLHLFECVILTDLHCGVLTDSMQQRLLSDCSFFIGRELFTGEWIALSLFFFVLKYYLAVALHWIEEHRRSCTVDEVTQHQWKIHSIGADVILHMIKLDWLRGEPITAEMVWRQCY